MSIRPAHDRRSPRLLEPDRRSRATGAVPSWRQHIHCRNCPVFAAAARAFFDRPAPEGYLAEWTALLGRARRAPIDAQATSSVLIFRLGGEWLALRTQVVVEVTHARPGPPDPAPDRTTIARRPGEPPRPVAALRLAARPARRRAPAEPTRPRHGRSPRLVVIRQEAETWVFAADEVLGVHRFAARPARGTSPRPWPTRPSASARRSSPGEGRSVGFLDEQRVFAALQEPGPMSDDLSGFSLMDLFRLEAEGQTAIALRRACSRSKSRARSAPRRSSR